MGALFLRYALLPGIRPRLEALFATGFQFIAYFIALVYGAVRLLPEGHPYLHPRNMGRFGVKHVIAEAANNLVLDKKNIDQILLFILILFGLGIMCVQVFLLGMGFIVQPVAASSGVNLPSGFSGFFINANPGQDLAGMMMDLVFGVPGLFGSCISEAGVACLDINNQPIGEGGFGVAEVTATATNNNGKITIEYEYESLGFPYPIHDGLHNMFLMYNTGLLVVATFIALYFAVTVIAETAQSGTPFGKRFNKVWAPLRIIFAFALLVPMDLGMNGSQYAVLYAAKFGSGFATNGWNLFNETLSSENEKQVTGMFGDGQKLVSTPNVPEIGALLQFFYLAKTCQHAQGGPTSGPMVDQVHMYIVKGSALASENNAQRIKDVAGTGNLYKDMIDFADGGQTLRVRFGKRAADTDPPKVKNKYGRHPGGVYAACGEITMRLTDTQIPSGDMNGVQIMQAYYWYLLKELWFTAYSGSFPVAPLSAYTEEYPRNHVMHYTSLLEARDPSALLPPNDYKAAFSAFFLRDIQAAMLDPSQGAGGRNLSGGDILNSEEGAIERMSESDDFAVDPVLKAKGWAGAAIWYNKVAELNGAVTSAVMNIPTPSQYPAVMEYVHREKKRHDNDVPFETRFEPKLSNGDAVSAVGNPDYHELMPLYWEAFNYWSNAGSYTEPTGNIMLDVINYLFGTEGLFNMRRNQDVHPLAQLVGVGRSLVEASIRNLAIGVVGGVAGGLGRILDVFVGEAASTASSFLVTIASVTLTAGFILFYVVPFLPFIYFFFAVGGWVKGIFEAMVGAPLWALAHIRIDGNGLPGQAAVAGYFLIFEIFLRPILIIFGLLASIATFSALVSVLNSIFDLVTSNLTGFDHRAEAEGQTFEGTDIPSSLGSLRSAIDQFFYTIVYCIIVYLMGMASFKMIDLVPNNILRWMGQSITTFNDEREDIAQQMVGKATVGAQQLNSSIAKGLQGITGLGGMR